MDCQVVAQGPTGTTPTSGSFLPRISPRVLLAYVLKSGLGADLSQTKECLVCYVTEKDKECNNHTTITLVTACPFLFNLK